MAVKFDPVLGRLREKDSGGGGGGGGDITISDVTGLQTALNQRVLTSSVGAANGVPSLGSDAKIPTGQLNLAHAVTAIPAATDEYTLAAQATNGGIPIYTHAPTTAPVYTLPDVSDTTIAHAIMLTVDFTTVQSCAFVDEDNNTIAPLDDLTILAGDVVQYLCWYDNVQDAWVISAGYIKARS